MSRPASQMGRADLLRGLSSLGLLDDKHAETEAAQRLAALSHLWLKEKPDDTKTVAIGGTPHLGDIRAYTDDAPISARPPLQAHLYAIVACERLAEPPDESSPSALKGLDRQDCAPRDPYGRLASPPLRRTGRFWPRLKAAVVRKLPGQALDLPPIVAALARGRCLARLPRRLYPYLPEHITVLADQDTHLRPYRPDRQQAIDILAWLVGAKQITVWTLRGNPKVAIAGWRRGAEIAPPKEMPRPTWGDTVVVLSDQGALRHPDGRAEAVERWRRHLDGLRRAGARILSLTPQRADPGATPHADARLERLLIYLSCARRIEPELVRALRLIEPALAAEPGLEALVWSHSSAMIADEGLCHWRPEAAAAYRRRLGELSPEQQLRLLDTLRDSHAMRGRAIEAQETLLWASHAHPDAVRRRQTAVEAARAWWRGLQGDMTQGDPTGDLDRFAAGTLAALDPDERLWDRQADLLGPLWAYCATRGLSRHVPVGLPAEHLGGWVARYLDKPAARRYVLHQRAEHLYLLPEGESGQSRYGGPLDLGELSHASGHSRQYLRPAGQAQPLFRLAPGGTHQIDTPRLRLTVAELTRPTWAREFGRDRFGLYADLEIAGVTQRLRWIEPGEFRMGSPGDEPERDGDEGPRHRVLISQGYWLADTACTQALWRAVMGANPSRFKQGPEAPTRPVDTVSWDDVQGFLAELGARLPGARAQLPSEAEWEYACRAGTETPFSFGTDITPEQVNYHGDFPYAGGKKGQFRKTTVPVKSLPANPWGLYEMHGNVWEWCADDLRDYRDRSETDPRGGEGDSVPLRVVRGGSWDYFAGRARAAFRFRYVRVSRDIYLGFRFALRSTEPGRAEPAGPAPEGLAGVEPAARSAAARGKSSSKPSPA